MGPFVAQRLVKFLANAGVPIKGARVGILGLTFKQDVPDVRNTKVADIVTELRQFGITPLVHDPLVRPEDANHEYGIRTAPWEELDGLDALVLAVPHREFLKRPMKELLAPLRQGGAFLDIKAATRMHDVRPDVQYWSL
jgi:UDP-N-acetyl-D-galactosamine dehydrogenase